MTAMMAASPCFNYPSHIDYQGCDKVAILSYYPDNRMDSVTDPGCQTDHSPGSRSWMITTKYL